jgi:hypothetical protein
MSLCIRHGMVVTMLGPKPKEAATVLRRIVAAVERGELTASASFIAFLKGAATALEGLPNRTRKRQR